jgi:phage shock protein PspC (stress-responsive transcriptional regulator)
MDETPATPAEPGGHQPPQPQDGPPPSAEIAARGEVDAFFARIREFGAFRVETGRWGAGVAGGLARRFDVDPLLVRGIFVVLTVISGSGFVLYALGWAFLPQEDGRIHAQELLRGRVSKGFAGAAVVFVVGLGSIDGPGWWLGPNPEILRVPGALAVVAGIAALIWWFATGRHHGVDHPVAPYGEGLQDHGPAPSWAGSPPPSAPRPAPPYPGTPGTVGAVLTTKGTGRLTTPAPPDHEAPSHALTLATLGGAMLVAALLGAWHRWVGDLPGDIFVVAAGAALGVIAIGVVLAGLLGRRSGGLAPIGLLLAVLVLASGIVSQGHGLDRTTTWEVTTRAAAVQGYELDVGSLEVDLTSPRLLAEAVTGNAVPVRARVGVGEIVIKVPDGVALAVHAQVGLGAGPQGRRPVAADGPRSGPGVDVSVQFGEGPTRYVVDAQVGLGAVHVVDESGKELR